MINTTQIQKCVQSRVLTTLHNNLITFPTIIIIIIIIIIPDLHHSPLSLVSNEISETYRWATMSLWSTLVFIR